MSRVFVNLFVCLSVFSFSLYSYLEKQNQCTQLKMRLPKVMKEIQAIQEENAHLQYQIECFEDPRHLLQIATEPAYSHLKFPLAPDILTLKEGLAVNSEVEVKDQATLKPKPKTPIVIGAR